MHYFIIEKTLYLQQSALFFGILQYNIQFKELVYFYYVIIFYNYNIFVNVFKKTFVNLFKYKLMKCIGLIKN